ncbi:biotin--[acetyl-CoA-carboxylase] ligase [Evansella sp. AB-rgal1]|uniref:biotin--[acetyl-CoA-carboxylase] ligase n=1 Tax=Evansella sp. AB-rgal1 TaxID=3242696 RepID=UPI00359E9536
MKAKVLQVLREADEFVSGEKISNTLSCSRTMVWKHIDALRKEGYEIVAVSNKGYKLTGEINNVSEHAISSRLQVDSMFQRVVYETVVDSTQTIANKLINEGIQSGTIVVANEQTGGKGRLGRSWHSPENTGVWMSLILQPEIEIRHAPQLTLVMAVAVVRAITNVTNLEGKIKWPNDILLNGKKVSGILTEMQADPDRIKSVVIGIGLNVNQQEFPEELSEIATSLSIESRKLYNRTEMIVQIVKEFEWLYQVYLEKGFLFIKPLWELHSMTIGKRVNIHTMREVIVGIAKGIDEDGVLIVTDQDGVDQRIISGDIQFANS